MQKNKEKYWDATAYELQTFLGKEYLTGHNSRLHSINYHSYQQVIDLLSFSAELKREFVM